MMSSTRLPAYHIRCFIHRSQNLNHLSYVHTGICALARQNFAAVEFKQPQSSAGYGLSPVAVWAEVTDTKTREERRIVFEISDHSNVFVNESLKLCDVYFKRSYYLPDLRQLSSDLRRKIAPFGLIYPCRSAESTRRTLSALLPTWALEIVKSPARTIRRLLSWELRGFLMSPDVAAFEHPPDFPLKRAVHFQSRIWEKESLGPDSPEEVNRPRVELTRLLKKEFGAAFHGGIVPTANAHRYCPDELSAQPKRRSAYVAQSKRIMIGIYTRGLHHSMAFKLAEYLAGSKCIVAEPLRNELPSPLVAGRNYLEFSSPEECIDRCNQILKDDALANQMRKDNWEYYQREVRPDRRIAHCLNQAFRRTSCAQTWEAKVPSIETQATGAV